MAGRTPVRVQHAMRDLGGNVRTWRKLNRLSQAMLAARANISEQTVRTIETGKGAVSTENLLRVLHVLGQLDGVVKATDPLESPVGRARADEQLPERVRRSTPR